MKNKNAVYSLLCLILGFVVLLTNPIPFFDNKHTDGFDDFVFTVTNYKWMWASTDITFVVSMAIPSALILLSIFFALKGLKVNSTQSKAQRMISIIVATISIGVPVTIVAASIYLWLTV